MYNYLSLLNFNFMASLRTGDVMVDMLIAMLIPFVTGFVEEFFTKWWPYLIQQLVHACCGVPTETRVIVSCDMAHGIALDMNENVILHEALMHYVGHEVRPMYTHGSYRFKRLPVKGVTTRHRSLAHTISSTYFLQTIPSKKVVDVAPDLRLRLLEQDDQEEEDKKKDTEGGREQHSSKHKDPNLKKEVIVFETSKRMFARQDAVMSFAKKAFQRYKCDIQQATDKARYLFQPLVSVESKASDSGNYRDTCRGAVPCHRYGLSEEKTFNTLFFPGKEKLVHLIEQFKSRSGKFSIPGFPHKLILLLYGPPGTGKTSLIKAIACHTHRHILTIPLSQLRSNRELLNLMFDGHFSLVNEQGLNNMYEVRTENLRPDRVVYMLEDVDAASDVVLRKKAEEPPAEADQGEKPHGVEKVSITEDPYMGALSVKGLLEALGGILDAPGRIIIMTTNHIEKLDQSLLRPGVVTMKLFMGNFNMECGMEMIRYYFRAEIEEEMHDNRIRFHQSKLENIATVFQVTYERSGGFSPAEVEQLCAENNTLDELLAALKRGSRDEIF